MWCMCTCVRVRVECFTQGGTKSQHGEVRGEEALVALHTKSSWVSFKGGMVLAKI